MSSEIVGRALGGGDYPGPVIEGPIQLLLGAVTWVITLFTVVFLVQCASGATTRDVDGDGIPDLIDDNKN